MADTENLVKAVVDLSPLFRQQVIRPMDTCAQPRIAPGQMAILNALKRGPKTMACLGRELMVCRQQMTGLIEELSRKELICRAQGVRDKRTVQVWLTEKGEQAVKTWEEEVVKALTPVFERYSDAQKTRLMESARTMHDIMQG